MLSRRIRPHGREGAYRNGMLLNQLRDFHSRATVAARGGLSRKTCQELPKPANWAGWRSPSEVGHNGNWRGRGVGRRGEGEAVGRRSAAGGEQRREQRCSRLRWPEAAEIPRELREKARRREVILSASGGNPRCGLARCDSFSSPIRTRTYNNRLTETYESLRPFELKP